MKIVLAGATGFIGKRLIERLVQARHQVIVLTRSAAKAAKSLPDGVHALNWDSKTPGDWSKSLEDSDAVINLVGESIGAKRWSLKQKNILRDSRIDSTRVIVEAIRRCLKKPRVFVNASAVGYYGNVPDGEVDESHPPADDFLGKLCAEWEAEAFKAKEFGLRVVCPRIGIVLGGGGGALEQMLLPFKLFVGGPLGSGRQWFPWIHRDDLIEIIIFALQNGNISGAVNAVSPLPVTMKEFCKTLGEVLKRPSWARVPAWILKIILGEFAVSVVSGAKAVPTKLMETNYTFRFSNLESALRDILK